jgi:hypothetical protein
MPTRRDPRLPAAARLSRREFIGVNNREEESHAG